MRVRLHERVLHRLVRLGPVAQIVKRDPGGAPLMARDQFGIALARLGVPSLSLHGLDGRGGSTVGFARRQTRWLRSCHVITPG